MPYKGPKEWRMNPDEFATTDEYIDLSNPVHRTGLVVLMVHYVTLHAIVVYFTSVRMSDLLTVYLVISGVILLLLVVSRR